MKSLVVPAVVIVAALAVVGLVVYGVAAKSDNRSLDSAVAQHQMPAAPGATRALPVLGGPGTRSLADYRGKVVVLNFWASWCKPCAAEAGALQRAQRRIAPRGATVLGVDWNDTESDASAFASRHGIGYPILRDVGGGLARAYGTNGLPETFVIDRRGRVTALQRFQVDDAFLHRSLAPLVG